MKRRATLKDIARHTGVHTSTVSRALDPSRSATISEAIIKQVRDTAADLGYRPNRLASGLRTNRSMTVGVMIPDITNQLFPPIVRGIESVLEPLGYASILVNTDSEPEREARLVEVLRDRGVDGIIHAAALRDDPSIARADEQGLPVVTLNRRIDGSDIPYIINDEAEGIRLAVQHLYDLGHRKIAHIAGPQSLSTGRLRLVAFRKVKRDLQLEELPELVVEAQKFEEDEGRTCAERLLSAGTEFTAIVCANDRLALGATSQLQSAGLKCPEDFSITGFNDMPFLELLTPALTTIRVEQFEAGAKSARCLMDKIEGHADTIELETVLPVSLIVRSTTSAVKEIQ